MTDDKRFAVVTAIVLGAALLAAGARAETIELVDKTKLNAKIIHYYDGVYTVEANGQTMKLPKEKIRSISFQLPPARPEFSTPEKTFERWRKALVEGAGEKAIDCYALMYQGMLATPDGPRPGAGRHQEDAERDSKGRSSRSRNRRSRGTPPP